MTSRLCREASRNSLFKATSQSARPQLEASQLQLKVESSRLDSSGGLLNFGATHRLASDRYRGHVSTHYQCLFAVSHCRTTLALEHFPEIALNVRTVATCRGFKG